MLYTLQNGKTIEISFEMLENMTQEDEEYLMAYNVGEYIEDPFYASSSHRQKDFSEEILPEITELDSISKLEDLDLEKDSI